MTGLSGAFTMFFEGKDKGLTGTVSELDAKMGQLSNAFQNVADVTGKLNPKLEREATLYDSAGKKVKILVSQTREYVSAEVAAARAIEKRNKLAVASAKAISGPQDHVARIRRRQLLEELKTADLRRTKEIAGLGDTRVRQAAEARINRARTNLAKIEQRITKERERQVKAAQQAVLAADKERRTRQASVARGQADRLRRETSGRQAFGQGALGLSSLLFGISQELGFTGLNVGFAALAGPVVAGGAAILTTIGSLGRAFSKLSDEATAAADNVGATSVALTQANRAREEGLALIGAEVQEIRARNVRPPGPGARTGATFFAELGLGEGFWERVSQGATERAGNILDKMAHDLLNPESVMGPGEGLRRFFTGDFGAFLEQRGTIRDQAERESLESKIFRATLAETEDELGKNVQKLEMLQRVFRQIRDTADGMVRLQAHKALGEVQEQLRSMTQLSQAELNLIESAQRGTESFEKWSKAEEKAREELEKLSETTEKTARRWSEDRARLNKELTEKAFPEREFASSIMDILDAEISMEAKKRLLFAETAGLGTADTGFRSGSTSGAAFFQRRFSAALSREPKEPKVLEDIKDEIEESKIAAIKAAAEELGVSKEIRDILRERGFAGFAP